MKTPNIVFILLMHCIMLTIATLAMYDPLQPIWNRIEQLPNEILERIERKMQDYTQTLDSAFNQQVLSFKSQLNATNTVFQEQTKDIRNVNEELHSGLLGIFRGLYSNQMSYHFADHLFFSKSIVMALLRIFENNVSGHVDKISVKDFQLELHFPNVTIEEIIYEDEYIGLRIKHLNGMTLRLLQNQDGCSSMGDSLTQYIEDQVPSRERILLFENLWDETYEAVTGEFPNGNPHRDCSDILFANPDAVSGVYDIFPSRDPKRNVTVWCDMETKKSEDEPSGWTVMLRRRNTSQGLLNFNRSWEEYSTGFGQPGNEGEWWLGLTWLHQLTYYQPYQVYFLFHDIEDGDFFAHYGTFRVESESREFRLVVDDFTGVDDLVDAFKAKHHGQKFSTADRDNDNCTSCNCAFNNQGGWWYNVCHRTVLTAPFPTSNDRDAATIRWLSGKWLVLDDVTMMVRPTLGH